MTIAVFRSYVASEHDRRYGELHALVQQSSGYIAHKLFTADDGESVVVVEFEDLDNLERWNENLDHKIAQEAGKSHVYTSYDVAVCEVVDRHTKTARTDAR